MYSLRAAVRITVLSLLLVVVVAVPANAASSVAYVDNGSVWLSTLDGAQKVKLADPVTRSDEAGSWQENWLDVAQSDGGRIVAVRNKPGRIANFSWFKIWEPDGTSTVEGSLNAPSGWSIYVYPLGFDITADGQHLVYGYSNSGWCCPITFAQGTYVRPATNSVLMPINISGMEEPSLFGRRIIAHSGSTISVQRADAGNPYSSTFDPWINSSGTGLDQDRADVAANGTLVALEVENRSATPEIGKIAVIAANGVDAPLSSPAPVDCYLPASGFADDASLSQDATRIAWTDAGGLKVAGTPTTAADPCVLTSPPVVISATGSHGSIGSADIARFIATGPTPQNPTPTNPDPTATAPVAPPVAQVEVAAAAAKFAAAQRAGGLPVTFPVREAGVRASATFTLTRQQALVFGLRPPGRATTLKVAAGAATSTTADQSLKVKLNFTRAFKAAFARTIRARPSLRSVAGTLTITLTRDGRTSTVRKAVRLTR
jgi:hypothetical protein